MGAGVSVAPARRAALTVLQRVRTRGAFGPETLDAVLRKGSLSAADASLATRLAYGTLESLGTLDDALDALIARPESVEPAVRDALRLAAYEILFARTPARAAVNEGVEAVKSLRAPAAGLANAVLRKLAARAPTFPWGDPAKDDEALARSTAHPHWLVEMWVAELGRARAVEALAADTEPAPLYLWWNPFAGSAADAVEMLRQDGAEPSTELPDGCLRAARPHAAVTGRAVAEGRVLITDAAAQLASRVVGAHPGSVVIDVAAGRGTKSAQLQAASHLAGAPARLFALDIHPFKAEVLARRMADLGVPDVTALTGDALSLPDVDGLPGPQEADAVLVDAPCTGLGALRRRPEKRWRVGSEDVARLADVQLAMLTSSASLVRPGGRVVYSTCTVSRVENHEVAASFLRLSEGEFATADITSLVPPEWRGDIGVEGWYQSVPRTDGPDGHFVAAFERAVRGRQR